MESTTIMGDPSPRQARFTGKLAALMIEVVPSHLVRLARRVRLLPEDPPPHAVTLAVVTAAVLGAATGVVLAIATPAPESSRALPAVVVRASFPNPPADVVRPGQLAVERPVAAAAPSGSAVAEPAPEVVARAMPAVAPSPPAATSRPPFATRLLTAPSLAPRGTTVRSPAARSPAGQANVATSPVSRRGGPPGAASALAADAASGVVGLPSLDPAASRAEVAREGTREDSSVADELIWLTERAFQSGHPAEAVRLGKKALAANGGARAHLALAAAYFDLRQFEDARASYEAVLQAEPGNQAARIGLDLAKTAESRPPEPQP